MKLYIFLNDEDIPYGNNEYIRSPIPCITSQIVLIAQHLPDAIEMLSKHLFDDLVDCFIHYERNEKGEVEKTFAKFSRDIGKETESVAEFQMIEQDLSEGIKFSFVENLEE